MDDSLSYRSLFAGARKFALSAWSAHNQRVADREVFFLHAGVSIERLAKAALARQSPILLMETNAKEDMILYFAGAVPATETRVRTIGAFAAITRLRRLAVLRPKDADLDGLIELRNGVAHLSASGSQGFDPVVTFARTTHELLEHLKEDPESYWGQMSPLVKIVLDEAQTEIERQTALLITAAKHRFEERFRGLQADAVENYRSTREGIHPELREIGEEIYFSESRTCPGCGCPGILDAKVLPLSGDSQQEIFFEAVALSCKHCELLLEGREQLVVADVDYAFSLPLQSMQRRHLFWHFMREGNPSTREMNLAERLFKGP
jgi:hypothetical protein